MKRPYPSFLLGAVGLSMALMVLPVVAQINRPLSSPSPKPVGCLIEPDHVANIGSQVAGIISRMQVDRGDEVRAGQAIAELRSDVERANAGIADAKVNIEADIRAAQANLQLAQQKHKRTQSLASQNFISQPALDQSQIELEIAKQRLRQAQEQQTVWRKERDLAKAQLGLRTLRSPISGVVVERYLNPGERIEEKPVVRIAVIHPLRVELMVPTNKFGTIRVGQTLSIQPDLPGISAQNAVVSHIDKVMDPASNTFRVRLKMSNAEHRIPAGLRCKTDWLNQTNELQATGFEPSTGKQQVPVHTSLHRSQPIFSSPAGAGGLRLKPTLSLERRNPKGML